ncbi:TadE/TadG family type IV pilus assembly protein [Streptacidiphilus sp. P02-A3a]|uniref:TadE/TadG family type IV pilus assembly protein n=1 Tax=Streptacidiphilus sp. P02-A3a TaxID=2704468 RepID=UPI0015F8851C|nr:TadE/TadG family type IV pilus assembly protein [Streptacidiphilus sp. P02-A3a]QMU68875.1 pilus assembly protein [Streptacidiphilus sp. P02-A3a]
MTHRHLSRPLAALDRLRGDDGGTTSISFALVFPVILVLVVLVVQGALWWWARTVALTAARDGASVARSYQSGYHDGAHRADQILSAYGDGLTVRPSKEVAVAPNEVRVTVFVRAQSVLPLLDGPEITIAVTSPKEAWLP